MRKFNTWVLTLGLATATPGITLAGPMSLWKSEGQPVGTQTAGNAGVKVSNQQVAKQIASALRNSNLAGNDISVEYKNGVARLTGCVKTPQERSMAEAAARRVPNVARVENGLTVTAPNKQYRNSIQQVQYEAPQGGELAVPESATIPAAAEMPADAAAAVAPVTSEAPQQDASEFNQRTADACKHALRSSGFVGKGVSLQFQEGILTIGGAVPSPQMREAATGILSQVPGVAQVDNQLQVAGPQHPVQATNYQNGVEPAPPVPVPAAPPGAYAPPPAPVVGPPPGYAGGPQAYPTPTGSQGMFDQPNLPNHSWPTYGTYPNYAQVAYPKQYSASAWPYIGPFYPYPQVPLGWRKVQMEWDDGYWQLNFRPRTEKWWWYLNPNNW